MQIGRLADSTAIRARVGGGNRKPLGGAPLPAKSGDAHLRSCQRGAIAATMVFG